MLLISEDLEELFTLSDRLIVLYEGRIVATFRPSETDYQQVGYLMTGSGGDHGAGHYFPKRTRGAGARKRPMQCCAMLLMLLLVLGLFGVILLLSGKNPIQAYARYPPLHPGQPLRHL